MSVQYLDNFGIWNIYWEGFKTHLLCMNLMYICIAIVFSVLLFALIKVAKN